MSGTGDLPAVPGSSEHPDHDLLADLAAEVLADDLAEQVQAHVVDCAACAGLLGEAEGIRTLLRQGEPDRMPADVMERLAAALASVPAVEGEAEEAASPAEHGTKAAAPTPSAGVTKLGSGADPRRRLTPALPKNRAASAAASTADTGRIARLAGRVTTPTESARRQAREEELADRPSLLTRFAPALRVAATLIVLLGVGGFLWNLISGSPDSANTAADSSPASAGAASGPPVLATVETTGTNYSASGLKKQVDTLIGSSQKSALKRASDASGNYSGATESQAAAPQASSLAAGADLLQSPAALRACLSAIGADDDQPVAVDLARWNDQAAAIIVLNSDGGGYDVWVVSRTCAPDADGTIAQEHIDS